MIKFEISKPTSFGSIIIGKNIKMRKYFLIPILLLIMAPSMASSLKRADSEDIDMLLNAASGMNSAFWASYIGDTRGKVYIEYETVVYAGSFFSKKVKHVVYWFPVSETSQEKLNKFKEYKEKYESRRK